MKNKQELTKIVIGILDDMLELNEYPLDATFPNLGMDSLDEVEFIMEVEEELSILMPDDIAENLNSINQTVDYLLTLPDHEG